MLTRRSVLGGIGAAVCAAPASGDYSPPAPAFEGPSLRKLAASRGLVFGCATGNYEFRDEDFTFAFLRDCAIMVPEYELKRDLIEPIQGEYDFSAPDTLLEFSRQHGLLFRGHPLVWYASNPPWLEQAVADALDESIFTDYVSNVVTHFRSRMHSWDVVNEAIDPKDGRADGLRDSFWLRKFGPSYIDLAFRVAHEADSSAVLVYNEYGIEEDGPDRDERRRQTLKLLEGLVARGVPVGALGIQAHLRAFGRTVNAKKLEAFLSEVRATGLRILVTEHDVDDSGGPIDFRSRDRAVADASRRFQDVVLDNPATLAVLTWGLSDRFLRAEGMRNALLRGNPRKLPLDSQMRPTAMRTALAQAFAGAPMR